MELKTYFAQDRNGSLIPSANVSIYLTGTTTLATGLKNVSGANLANPFTADADGKIQFYAPDGIYDMQVSLGSTTGVKVTFQCLDVQEQLSGANSAADRAEDAAERAEDAAENSGVNTFLVASQAEMLALTAKKGDHAKRSDISKTFILQSAPASTLASWVSIDDDALFQLAKPGGVVKVNGAIVECDTVANAQAIIGLTEGKMVRTYQHNVSVISDWKFTTTQPASPTFYITAVGGYLVLLTPNFASAGITPAAGGLYVPAVAAANRNKMQALTRDTRFKRFNFGCSTGKFYGLGSICPLRSDIYIFHEFGVEFVGRYDDPSIPTTVVPPNTGGLWAFVLYLDPDQPIYDDANYVVTGTISNVIYELEGTLRTEYNSIHSKAHNNNAIGFYTADNCHVIGTGTITGSDHRGVCFDGTCTNCSVKLTRITGTSDEPIVMRGDPTKTKFQNVVDIASADNILFDGPNAPIVVECGQGGNTKIHIGVAHTFGRVPQLVRANNADFIEVSYDNVDGVSQILRQYESVRAHVKGGITSNTPSIVNRAETAGATRKLKRLVIEDVICIDGVTAQAYQDETNTSVPDYIEISKCDFSLVPNTFRFKRGITTGVPVVERTYDNLAPDALTSAEANYQSQPTGNIVSGLTSPMNYTYNGKYRYLNVSLTGAGGRYNYILDMVGMLQSSTNIVVSMGSETMTVSHSGNAITVTGSGTLKVFYAYASN